MSSPHIAVVFCLPWCGWSRHLQTSSAATAADLVNHLPEAQLAQVRVGDAGHHKPLPVPPSLEWRLVHHSQIFRDLGEERRARTAAAVIVERRARQPFTRTADLAACLEARLRVRPRKGVPKRHAATKCFQVRSRPSSLVPHRRLMALAVEPSLTCDHVGTLWRAQALRIAVNHELRWLEKGVQECVRCLRPGAALGASSLVARGPEQHGSRVCLRRY